MNERFFIPVADQLANVRRWNEERGWGFTDADFDAVDTTPVVHDKPLVVDVVAVFLPEKDGVDGVRRTFEELWAVASEGVPENWSWRQHLEGPRPVKLLPGGKHVPGIRRVTIDLARGLGPGRRGPGHRDPGPPLGVGRDPGRGRPLPRVDAGHGGRAACPSSTSAATSSSHPENEAWRHVPCLSWNEFLGRVNLMDHWADHHQRRWAVPASVSTARA